MFQNLCTFVLIDWRHYKNYWFIYLNYKLKVSKYDFKKRIIQNLKIVQKQNYCCGNWLLCNHANYNSNDVCACNNHYNCHNTIGFILGTTTKILLMEILPDGKRFIIFITSKNYLSVLKAM